MVCQAMLAYSSTLYLNIEDCRGRTGLSPPAAYPSTMEYKANEGSLYPRHHICAIDYYSSVKQGDLSLSRTL
jgi:hypothetical protein